VAYLLKAKIVGPAETAVARERVCKHMPLARKWFGDSHVIAATVPHGIELLEAMFSVWSVPRIYVYAIISYPSGAHNSGYGEWHPRGTRATQCLGV
jgi:hypothetical protein